MRLVHDRVPQIQPQAPITHIQAPPTSTHQTATIVILVSPSAAEPKGKERAYLETFPFPPLGTTWVEAAEGESAVTHISIRSIDADRIHK